jgi:hypothetical protein
MRRTFLLLALFVLTGTLLAQTPTVVSRPRGNYMIWGMPFTAAAAPRDGKTMRLTDATFDLGNAVTVTADEAVIDPATESVTLLGRVVMTQK